MVRANRRELIRPKALKLMAAQAEKPRSSRLSMKRMAEQLGVSTETLYRIKRGERAPRQLKGKSS